MRRTGRPAGLTPRYQAADDFAFQPAASELGRLLHAARAASLRSGGKLLTPDDLAGEIRERRGGIDAFLSPAPGDAWMSRDYLRRRPHHYGILRELRHPGAQAYREWRRVEQQERFRARSVSRRWSARRAARAE